MKNKSVALIFILLGIITCTSPQCNPPAVLDIQLNSCLQGQSNCASPKFYLPNTNTCDTACPQNYTESPDTTNHIMVCVAPPFECPLPQILSIGGNYDCFLQTDNAKCTMMLVGDKDGQYVCLSECPANFTQSADGKSCTSNDSTFSWTNNAFINCKNGIRDVQTLTCLSSPDQCSNVLLSQTFLCVKSCPSGFFIQTNPNSNMKQCVNNQNNSPPFIIAQCTSSQIYDQSQNICLANDTNCNGSLISDSVGNKLCWPFCPTGILFVESTSSSGQKLCAAPSGKNLKTDYNYFNCDPPKFRDQSTLSCIDSYDLCQHLIVYDQYICDTSCPPNYQQVKDPNNRDACVNNNTNNNNNNNNNYSMKQCDGTTQFLHFKQNSCISADKDCGDFLVKDTSGMKVCWPSCPSNFTQSKDATTGIQYCTPPTAFKLSSAPIFQCAPPKIADLTTFGCLDNFSSCTKIMVPQRNQCVEACYNGAQLKIDQNGNKYCDMQQQQQCSTNQAQDYVRNYCQDPSQCKGYIIQTDNGSMICIPQCPSSFTSAKSTTSSIQTCTPPNGQKLSQTTFGNCDSPKIRDFIGGNCLTLPTDCKGIIIQQLSACFSTCPNGFFQQTDGNNVKSCLPQPNCASNQTENFLDHQCILPSQCKNYLIQVGQNKYSCVPECPSIFIISTDNINKINLCTPPAGKTVNDYPIGPCDMPMIRDFTNGGCLSQPSNCKGIFLRDLFACVSACPVGTNQQTDNTGALMCVIQQQYQQVSCKAPAYLNYSMNNCITLDTDCKGVIITDVNSLKVCWPACPSAWLQSDKSCLVPTTFDFTKSDIMNCPSPSIQSVDDLKCLTTPADCKGIVIPDKNQCVLACPDGTIQITDQKTQIKMCAKKNTDGGVNCPQPLIENFLKGDCLNPVECDLFLLNTGNNLACIPECPSIFVQGKDANLGVQTCTPPNNKPVNNYPIGGCSAPNIRDFSNAQCLTDASQCTGIYIQDRNACLSACPPKWSLSTNASGQKICVPPLKCIYPQIFDTQSKTCLDSISKCNGVFNKDTSSCDKECMAGFVSISDANLGSKVCIPCFFKDSAGNCYDKCPPPLISIPPTVTGQPGSCTNDTSSCKGYITKALGTCEDKCRFGYSPVDTSTPKSCIPCALAGSCASQNSNSCTMKLSSDKTICDSSCPPNEIPLPQLANQTYQQCQKCPALAPFISIDGLTCQVSCDSTLVIEKSSNKCIPPSLCSGVIYTDNNNVSLCIQRCPSGYQVITDADTKVKSCQVCSSGSFFDQITQTCSNSCTIKDVSGTYCLISIDDCIGYISVDKSTCLSNCAGGQFMRPLNKLGQFQCLVACDNNEFVQDQVCLLNCPKGLFGDKTTKKCIQISSCQGYYSIDKSTCLDSCPQGQYPITEGTSKRCQICKDKVSSDGKSCGSGCAASEYFDLDLQICVASTGCDGKIISTDGKSCSKSCLRGQILSNNAGTKSCLNKIQDCTLKITSDFSQCVASCNSGEISITKGSNTICAICPLGASADGKSCNTQVGCLDTQYFDEVSASCVSACAAGKFITSVGRRCVAKCVYPDVKKSGNTTNCFAKCDDGQALISGECANKASCPDYLTSDGQCIPDCTKINQVNDSSKTCVQCSDDTIPRLIGGVIKCQAKSDDNSANTQVQSDTMKTIIQDFATIPPEFKAEIKNQIVNISQSLEDSVKQTKNNSNLSDDDKKKQIINLINNLKDIGKSFISKIEQSSSADTTGQANDKLTLGSDQFQYVAEKKKVGSVFSISFNVGDFYGATSPNLQKDASSLDATAAANTDGSINSLATTNQVQNPHCSDLTKCGSVGLFSVEATAVSGKRRILAGGSQATFQVTYNVAADQLSKTICVSFDETTSAMTPSTATTVDSAANKITCTFVNNSSLYYDSSCDIISASNCQAQLPQVTQQNGTTPSSGLLLNLAMIQCLVVFYLI